MRPSNYCTDIYRSYIDHIYRYMMRAVSMKNLQVYKKKRKYLKAVMKMMKKEDKEEMKGNKNKYKRKMKRKMCHPKKCLID